MSLGDGPRSQILMEITERKSSLDFFLLLKRKKRKAFIANLIYRNGSIKN